MIINSHVRILIFYSCCVLINGYINVRLEDKLCASGDEHSEITLLEGSDSAAIFTQQWNSSLSSNNMRYHCEFTVLSNKDAYRIPKGTYTVISRIKFRKMSNTNECLDYIQIRTQNSTSDRICRDISEGGSENQLILDNRFRDIHVIIHIDNSSKITEPLELRMVFTAHSQCTHSSDFLCDPNLPYSCISRHFLHDNVTNCMPPCRDESSCLQEAAEAYAKSPESNDNETRDEKFDKLRIADDSTSCITLKLLEDKLKENTNVLRVFMWENEDRLLNQINGRIKDNDISKCTTGEFFEAKLKENAAVLIGAIKSSEDRLSSQIDRMMIEFKKDLLELTEKFEILERSG